jgi:hypothetical protein
VGPGKKTASIGKNEAWDQRNLIPFHWLSQFNSYLPKPSPSSLTRFISFFSMIFRKIIFTSGMGTRVDAS